MRIAFFADSYKPYLSGVTNSAEILVNELRALGHRVYVLAPRYPNHVDTDPDIFRFPSFAGGYPKFRLAIPIVREIPAVDIIHSHSPFQAGLAARFVARRGASRWFTHSTLCSPVTSITLVSSPELWRKWVSLLIYKAFAAAPIG